jgi:branched-chain amino acid transport system ATP-binding protein
MPDAVLELTDLQAGYGAVTVLRGVTITIGKGEIVGLVGPNGAGKTTTLLTVMGIVKLKAGDVRLAGRSLRGSAPERIVRSGVALVPEGRHIFPQLTVEENLRLGLVGRGESSGFHGTASARKQSSSGSNGPASADNGGTRGDMEWIAELFPVVREFRARKAGALSGGQQQQLAIARALLARPQVLLLDEPALGLSPAMVERVWGALAEIRRAGVTMLLVEQRAQVTTAFCDRTHVMTDGQIRMTLTQGDATDTERLISAYFGS